MTHHKKIHDNPPIVGILMLETSFPRIPGDIGNPETFAFPVLYQTVQGASPERVVIDADAGLIQGFIEAGRLLVSRGVKVITTSCGFLALFQRQLADTLSVPVFASSLLQVHLARSVIRSDQKIGILTARKQSLTPAHLYGVGVKNENLAIIGMDDKEEFSAVFIDGKSTLDEPRCRQEMQSTALSLLENHPDVGAIVLECTNMPPYAGMIREMTGLPVFDAVTLVNHAHSLF